MTKGDQIPEGRNSDKRAGSELNGKADRHGRLPIHYLDTSVNFAELVKPGWNVADEIIILGLQDVDGFGDEVAIGTTVEVKDAAKNILKKVRAAMSASEIPVKAIVSECTELPGYTNMMRAELGVPVFDAITAAGLLYNAIKPRDKYAFDPCYA